MAHRGGATAPRFRFVPTLLIVLCLAALAGLVYVAARMMAAPRPTITFLSPFDKVGRGTPLAIDVADLSGLRSVSVTLVQGDQRHVILEKHYDPPPPKVEVRWARDRSPRSRWRRAAAPCGWRRATRPGATGSRAAWCRRAQDFEARLVPPRLEVLTGQHYVNQGGCDMVVYKVTPPGRGERRRGRRRASSAASPLPGARRPGRAHSRSSRFPTTPRPTRPCASAPATTSGTRRSPASGSRSSRRRSARASCPSTTRS